MPEIFGWNPTLVNSLFTPKQHLKICPVCFPCGLYWYLKSVKITDLHQTNTFFDGDSRKHPLKYFCLKLHILMRNNLSSFAFGVYRSVSIWFVVFFLHRCHAMCNRFWFFTIFSWLSWLIALKLLQVCQFMYVVDNIKSLHCQQLFC